MRIQSYAAVLGFALLSSCGGPAVQGNAVPLFTTILDAMRIYGIEDGEDARAAVTQRPWLVDVESFVIHGKQVVGPGLRGEDVAASIPSRFRSATVESAIRCSFFTEHCKVRNEAFHMRLDSMAQMPAGVVAVVTYRWTDRRASGLMAIGFTQRRLLLTQAAGRWVVAESRILAIT